MNTLKQIREQLGISQAWMAVLLGVTRTTIAMAETGQRALPTPALELLSKMARQLPPALPGVQPAPQQVQKLPKTLKGLHAWAVEKGAFYQQLAAGLEAAQQRTALLRNMLAQLFPAPNKKQALVIDLLTMEEQKIKRHTSPALAHWCRQPGDYLAHMPPPPVEIQ